MKNRIGLILLALLLTSCAKEGQYSSSIADLGLRFSSKAMCSCLWVSENSEDFCLEHSALKQVTPKIKVDNKTQIVEASLFWIFSSNAQFIDPKSGCKLLN